MLKLKKKDKSASEPKKAKRQSASNPQGITASGNALYKVAGMGLGVFLLALAVGFGYLLLLREAGLQHQQVDRVANATGIPLDAGLAAMSGEVREELDLARFSSSANTPGAG